MDAAVAEDGQRLAVDRFAVEREFDNAAFDTVGMRTWTS